VRLEEGGLSTVRSSRLNLVDLAGARRTEPTPPWRSAHWRSHAGPDRLCAALSAQQRAVVHLPLLIRWTPT